jgi:hypothetical protein
MVMYSFVPLFREAKCCGVPSCAFDKLGCAAGEKRLRNAALATCPVTISKNRMSLYASIALFIKDVDAIYIYIYIYIYI